MTPTKRLRFLHSRQIDGSPKAGTARPVEMIITAVRRGQVYYDRADSPRPRGAFVIDADRFSSIVRP
jgi:hypothetical protein